MAYWFGYMMAMAFTVAAIAAPVFFLLTRKGRSLWLRPLRRRRAERLNRHVTMAQARRDARTAVLEANLSQVNSTLEKFTG